MTSPTEVSRVLRDGTEITTPIEPSDVAGLAVAASVVLPESDSNDEDSDSEFCDETVQPAGEAPTVCGLERPCSNHGEGSDITVSPLVASDQWIVLHAVSAVPVIQLPTPRVIAHQLAHELGTSGLDWTLPREQITGSHRSLYLATVRESLSLVWDFIGWTDGEFTARHDDDQEVA